jgi:hypothetical protein
MSTEFYVLLQEYQAALQKGVVEILKFGEKKKGKPSLVRL